MKSAPGRATTLRYEDLHRETSGVLQSLFDFLGVDRSAEYADACAQGADFRKFSGGRDRGDEDSSAQFRKGIVGDWRSYPDTDLTGIFREAAADVMDEFGYA